MNFLSGARRPRLNSQKSRMSMHPGQPAFRAQEWQSLRAGLDMLQRQRQGPREARERERERERASAGNRVRVISVALMHSTIIPLFPLISARRHVEWRSVRAACASKRRARVRSAARARSISATACSPRGRADAATRAGAVSRVQMRCLPSARVGAVAANSWDWPAVSEAAQTTLAPGKEQ